MKKIPLILSLFLLFGPAGAYAQDRAKNTISLEWGVSRLQRQDLVFSPFIHTDFSAIQGALVYARDKKLYHNIRLGFVQYDPMQARPYIYQEYQETKTAHPHLFTFVDLDYILAKPLWEYPKARLLLGGSLLTDVQAMDYVYGRISNFGYFASIGLGLYTAYQQQIKEKHQLFGSLQLPLVSWIARSPYLVNDDEFIENISSHKALRTFFAFIEDGQLTGFNRWQAFNLSLMYHYRLGARWELGTHYQLDLLHASKPANLLSYQNRLSLGSRFSF